MMLSTPNASMKWSLALAILLLVPMAGCITDAPDVDAEEEAETPSLNRMNIVAQTLDRDVDQHSEYNVLENSSGQNTLILWAASGCRGCHEWTEMIRESIANGTISNDSNVITVQRYPSFESRESFFEVFGNESSEQYSPWPVLTPYSSAGLGTLRRASRAQSLWTRPSGIPEPRHFRCWARTAR